MSSRRPAWLAGALLLVACDGEREQELRAEAARIAKAVADLREAPNSAKRPRRLALEQEPCSDPRTCRLRDECARAYATHERGLSSVRAAKRGMDAGKPADVARLLSESEKTLAEAERATRRCADLQAQLEREL